MYLYNERGLSLLKAYFTNKFYDAHLLKFESIHELLINNEIHTILDIGSYNGSDAIILSRIFSKATIYCFEADNNNFKKLVENVQFNKRIVPINIAVSDKEEVLEFYPSDGKNNEEDFKGSGSILKPTSKHSEIWGNLVFNDPLKVKAVSINSWAKANNINQIDFVWMDVQGAELKVLKGFEELLPTTKAVILEIWDNTDYYQDSVSFASLQSFFAANNFRMSNLWKMYFSGDALFINGKYY